MTMSLKEISLEAKKLREDEREILIHELMSGLTIDEQKNIDQIQMSEVKTRLKDMKENPSGLLDGDQVILELQKEFE